MFQDQVDAFLKSLNSDRTKKHYGAALREFRDWYVGSYGVEPDATLLTDEEVRDWRSHLVTVRRLSAATVNQKLAALKGLARFHGRELRVKGIKRVIPRVLPRTI